MKTRIFFAYFYKFILSVLFILILGILIPVQGNLHPSNCNYKIYIAADRIHSNIIVTIQNEIFNWQHYFPFTIPYTSSSEGFTYLVFGWGEQNFYTYTPTRLDLKLYKGFKALFFSNPSVMRVQMLRRLPRNLTVKCIQVSKRDYLQLMEFIQNSFQSSPQGEMIQIAYYPQYNARFYQAKGRYSILRTSNSWTTEGLRIANVDTPLWGGLSWAVMFHLHENC